MKDFIQRKTEAWAKHHERFDCQHLNVNITKRVIKGGAIQYVEQCLTCGKPASSPMKKEVAFQLCDGHEPEAYDQQLSDAFDSLREAEALVLKQEFDKEAFHQDYGSYLASPEWRAKRQMVFKRSNGVCEGCGINKATEVHHLTYANVGQEFLFELVAICEPCHDRLHNEQA
jgi:5-methylcytosine-specific restriction endonuclease McrA